MNCSKNKTSIEAHFGIISDPRHHNKKHKIIDIITLSICATICGADTYKDIEAFGKAKFRWLNRFLELPYGIPSHDTLGRVFAVIDPKEFHDSFINWTQAVQDIMKGQVIAVDGKTLRRSFDTASDMQAIHMVSAWASSNRVVLGQIKTIDKSNEITAIPLLLKMLDISGCIVTIDAMGCQKKIAETILKEGGDYLFSLKGNQSNLHNDIKLFFDGCIENNFEGIPHDFHETIDTGHGRIETRKVWTTSDIKWLDDFEKWKGFKTIGMVESERLVGEKSSKERRFFISSSACGAKEFGAAVRAHWGIENSVHWTLDIAFREDESRVRKNHAPENLATLRHIALNLLRNEKSMKGSIKTKRLRAGWDTDYLKKVVTSA